MRANKLIKTCPSNNETYSILEFFFQFGRQRKPSCSSFDDDLHLFKRVGNEVWSLDNEDAKGGVIALDVSKADDKGSKYDDSIDDDDDDDDDDDGRGKELEKEGCQR